jgi:hypothetical protein
LINIYILILKGMRTRYNPKNATSEYWCDNRKVKFISEIYNKLPYSYKNL